MALSITSSPASLAWFVSNKTDDFGSQYTTVSTYYTSEVGQFDDLSTLSNYTDTVFLSLTMRCRDKKFEIYSAAMHSQTNDDVLDTTQSSVQIRFNNSFIKSWPVSASSTSFFYSNPISLWKKLLASKSFAFRAQGNQGDGIAAHFNLAGIAAYKSTFRKLGCSV